MTMFWTRFLMCGTVGLGVYIGTRASLAAAAFAAVMVLLPQVQVKK